MIIDIKETDQLSLNQQREEWLADPNVNNYIYFQESSPAPSDNHSLTNFQRYYEIYDRDQLVGDIKIFYENEEDIVHKRGQILMVIGNRNNGIGTNALQMLLERVKDSYNSVYCYILRSNIASLKMLKRNGFEIDKIDGDNLLLSKDLN